MGLAGARAKKQSSGALRTDPKPRHLDGSANWLKLENRDPTRKYVFCNRLDTEGGLDYYLSLGAKIETFEKGGVRIKSGRTVKDGEDLENAGQVLVSFPQARWDEIVQFGPDGNSGQALLDEVEGRMLERTGVDHLRGIGTRPAWMQFQNEISPLQVEG